MTPYRLFPTNVSGKIVGPPEVIEAEDDQQAVHSAAETLGGQDRELWDGARRVAQFSSGGETRPQVCEIRPASLL